MAHWLVKSEPNVFSYEDLIKTGAKGEPWTGVRNHQAKLYLMAMKTGERALFYHSNVGKEIVGVAEVVKPAYPDPTAESGPWVCVDLKAHAAFKTPVTLAAAKADPKLAAMMLVKNTRFSVQIVTEAEWTHLCKLGGVKG
jgi:predicted RNA-binding protein with PUA-like domain